jgi:hypothetical protein
MADVDTLMLSREHSDIRREAAEHTNEIVKEGLKGDYLTQGGIKDARFDINSREAFKRALHEVYLNNKTKSEE